MSDADPHYDRPVLNGLVALVAVALGVGLILGLVALVASSQLGLGDSDTGAASGGQGGETMSIPAEFESTDDSGPRITLATEDPDEAEETETADDEATEEPSATETTSEAVESDEISLQAAATTVTAGERIYFSGVYPAGEGAILWVQRFENGAWADFPASVGVTNGTFSSYVFTGVSGVNRFRVIDRDTGTASNEISVRVG